MIVALVMLVSQTPPAPKQWGHEAINVIRRDYYLRETKLYAERPDRKQPAFNWGVGVMLSALNAAAQVDAKYKPWLREYADASRAYWNDGGYDVLPAPKPKDRYYDDNAWMALALVETFETLGDRKYLTWASETLDFALQGEAKDGGIYWRESDRASRNTCSNAPTAASCMAIYRHTKEQRLKGKAESIYFWTKKHLQDPTDGLYWDSVSNSGKLDRTKWTYNTALMIRTARELGFSEDVKVMVEASRRRWLKDRRLDDSGRFAHLLLEALLDADGVKPEYLAALEAVHNSRSAQSHYPSHWSQLKVDKNPEILDQASFARACFVWSKAR